MASRPTMVTHPTYHFCETALQCPLATWTRIIFSPPDSCYLDIQRDGRIEISARVPQTIDSPAIPDAVARARGKDRSWMMIASSHLGPSRLSSMDVNSKEPNIINWNNSAAEIEDPGTGGGTNHDIHVGARFFPDIVKLNNEQWQALIALHRALPYDCHAFFLASQHLFACPTLLHEHHPFFLAFQHRYACSSPLKRVDKNAMPAGMWRRGIDSFLRLFKFSILRLFHCMLTFIYLVWNRISRPWLYPMARNKGLLLKGLHYNPATLVRWWWAEEDYEAVANVLTFRSETPRPKSTKSQRWKGFGAIVLEISLLVWQITSGFWWVSNQLILALCRCFQRSVRRHAFCFIPFLVSVASASVRTNSVDCTPETGQPMAPGYQGDNSGLSWPWYPVIVAGILVVEFAAVHILHQPLLFHGASMGISAGAFLLMAFNDEVPFRLQFSTWAICAILSIVWIHYDTADLRQEPRQAALLCVIVGGVLLDVGISSAFASGGNSMFATNDSPSAAFLLASFLLPCISMSAFLCRGTRGLYRQVTTSQAG